MQEIELLQYVHETAQMGIIGLQDVMGRIHDQKLKRSVQSQIDEYRTIGEQSARLLRTKGKTPKEPSWMARLSSRMMSSMQTLADSSTSHIAEMVIRGNQMGITQGLKHLHDYEGHDTKARAIAERLLSTEQTNLDQMKPFL